MLPPFVDHSALVRVVVYHVTPLVDHSVLVQCVVVYRVTPLVDHSVTVCQVCCDSGQWPVHVVAVTIRV